MTYLPIGRWNPCLLPMRKKMVVLETEIVREPQKNSFLSLFSNLFKGYKKSIYQCESLIKEILLLVTLRLLQRPST